MTITPPNITSFFDFFSFLNTITNNTFWLGILIAIQLILLFSLFREMKEKALLASGAITTTIAIIFAFANLIAHIWILLFLGIFCIGIVLSYVNKSEYGM